MNLLSSVIIALVERNIICKSKLHVHHYVHFEFAANQWRGKEAQVSGEWASLEFGSYSMEKLNESDGKLSASGIIKKLRSSLD